MCAVVPRQNALGSRKRGSRARQKWRTCSQEALPISRFTSDPADGKSLLAARARLNAVAQWHSRWEYPWMKHGETAGTGGNENMEGVGIAGIQT